MTLDRFSQQVRILCFSLCLFVLAGPLSAQQNPYPDELYLKNGSVLKCKILDYKAAESIKIEIQGGSILVYTSAEIQEIVRDGSGGSHTGNPKAEHWYQKDKKDPHFYNKGEPYFNFNMNSSFGFKERTDWWSGRLVTVPTFGFGFDFAAGAAINRHLMVGGGIAWTIMDNYFMYSSHIPIFAEVRGDINKGATSLYYSLGLGYNWALMQQNRNNWNGLSMVSARGGIYVNPEIGLRFKSTSKVHFTTSFNYAIHTASYTYLGPNSELIGPTRNVFMRPTISFGIMF